MFCRRPLRHADGLRTPPGEGPHGESSQPPTGNLVAGTQHDLCLGTNGISLVVRLVRIPAESDVAPAGLPALASAGAIDVLQLDYARPRFAPAPGTDAPALPERASSFCETLHGLCTSLFLEPDFHIITSAGWSDSYAFVEQAARALVAGGSPDVPLSAVRGANLMGILDYLVADGVRLDNIDTGAPWRSLREPLLAADLQLGAGPIRTALDEGARVIVAGCYDGAAPAIAAATRTCGWSCKQVTHIACAAAAARAAIWPNRHVCQTLAASGELPAAHLHPRIEVHVDGGFTVDVSHPADQDDAKQLLAWLQAGKLRDPAHLHADVTFDARSAEVERTGSSQLRVTGCTGVKSDDHWRVEVLYQAGFLAETMVEFSPGAGAALRRQIAEAFRTHFVDEDDERSLVTVQELAPADGGAESASWLHLACRSKHRRPCGDFAEHVARLAAANPGTVRLPAGRPAIQAECGLWPARIPRNAIDIAIDTRPAKEWE